MKVHDDAFMALILPDPVLSKSFEGLYEGPTGARPPNYAAVFPTDSRSAHRFTGPEAKVENEYVVHSVAKTRDSAKIVREHVYARVLGVTPQVAGWKCTRVRFVASRPLDVDRDVSPPLFFMVDVFAFDAEPA